MKHIHTVTKGIPGKAEVWQEFVCSINQFLADALTAKGGTSPFIAVIENKCDLPVTT